MIAEKIGDFFVAVWDFMYWLFASMGPVAVLLGLAALYLLWRVSLTFGPLKLCWRCKGKGHVGGWFGGRAKCSWCQGEGVRPRAGSKK